MLRDALRQLSGFRAREVRRVRHGEIEGRAAGDGRQPVGSGELQARKDAVPDAVLAGEGQRVDGGVERDRARLRELPEQRHGDDPAPGAQVEDPARPRGGPERLEDEDFGFRAGDEPAHVDAERPAEEVPLADQVLHGRAREPPRPELLEALGRALRDREPGIEAEGIRMAEHVRQKEPRVPESRFRTGLPDLLGCAVEAVLDGQPAYAFASSSFSFSAWK